MKIKKTFMFLIYLLGFIYSISSFAALPADVNGNYCLQAGSMSFYVTLSGYDSSLGKGSVAYTQTVYGTGTAPCKTGTLGWNGSFAMQEENNSFGIYSAQHCNSTGSFQLDGTNTKVTSFTISGGDTGGCARGTYTRQ